MTTPHEEAMTLTKSRTPGTAVAAALALTLLSGCGGTDTAAVPDGWGTLDTRSVSVGYPKNQGYAPQPAAERSKANAAVALKEEKGCAPAWCRSSWTSPRASATRVRPLPPCGAGIGIGATRKDTRDVRLAGEESAREARRIDYEFTSTGEESTPAEGTRMTGVVVAGVDSQDVPFAIRINAVKDALSAADLDSFVASITVK